MNFAFEAISAEEFVTFTVQVSPRSNDTRMASPTGAPLATLSVSDASPGRPACTNISDPSSSTTSTGRWTR